MSQLTIGIVGLGLIGGSIALRAKAASPGVRIIGANHRIETAITAHTRGMIDHIARDFSEFSAADIVFVCTPIPIIFSTLVELDLAVTGDTLLTDVGSLKGTLYRQVQGRSWRHPVVLGHPMAGKETIGLDSADANLLVGKPYIVIDDIENRLSPVLQNWGCRVMPMAADVHDRYVGFASHLPYLASIIGSGMASAGVPSVELFSHIASSGFRDTSRVSASDPHWGADVLLGNSPIAREGIDIAQRLLGQIDALIRDHDRDGLVALLGGIKGFRDQAIP